jgi:hypothetical protein
MKYIDSENENIHFFKLSRDGFAKSSVYVKDILGDPSDSPDEGEILNDIVKITFIESENKIKFEDSTLYPNMVLKEIISAEYPVSPKRDSLEKFIIFLTNIANILFNNKKKREGFKFKLLSDKSVLDKLQIELVNDLESIYNYLIDYLPENPKKSDESTEIQPTNEPSSISALELGNKKFELGYKKMVSPEPISTLTPDEINKISEIDDILESYSLNDKFLVVITEKIDQFLKETCNIKSSEDKLNIEKDKYDAFVNDPKNRYSKNKLPRSIVNIMVDDQKELKNFCENSELGKTKANNDLKNTAILVNGYFKDTNNGDLFPKISNKYSEDFFTYKAEVSEDYPDDGYCMDGDTFAGDIYVLPRESEKKKCDSTNFANQDEILGVCNIENKNLLEKVCISYGAKMKGSGYPETKCKISHLNKLTEECNKFDYPEENDCEENNYILPGCNRYSKNKNVKPLVKSFPTKIMNISELGACNTMAKYTSQTEIINEQTKTNRKKIEEHVKKRDQILKNAEDINLIHKMDQNAHEEHIEYAKERNADITRARICTAQRKKYNYKTNKCTNEYLDPIPDPNEKPWRKCIQEKNDLEATTKVKIVSYITFFIIFLFVIIYFSLVRN